jgi:osmotically-inducible protein OsmY
MTVATLLATVLLGCAGADKTEDTVKDALRMVNIDHVAVEVDGRAEQPTVRLSGTVDTLSDRARAAEIAQGVVGTSGTVRNDLAVVGLHGRATDMVE